MKRLPPLAAALLLPAALAATLRLDVALFSRGDMAGWEPHVFHGHTSYTLVPEGSGQSLRADSYASASGLIRDIQVDLARTPYLNWSWKVGNVLQGNDERTRAGDDYPARIYVAFRPGLLFWRTPIIDYVWTSHLPVGTVWRSAYVPSAVMIAVDSGEAGLGTWVSHRRDVRADYRQVFGEEPGPIEAVAIMSDTDDTGQRETAWYGDIWFSSD